MGASCHFLINGIATLLSNSFQFLLSYSFLFFSIFVNTRYPTSLPEIIEDSMLQAAGKELHRGGRGHHLFQIQRRRYKKTVWKVLSNFAFKNRVSRDF